MSETLPPPCPRCEGPMRLTTDRVPDGMAQYWACLDRTCMGLVEVGTPPRQSSPEEDYLGAPVEQLMEAPVTPQGGSSGRGKSRRGRKPGDEEAKSRARERRYLDQAALGGGRDREVTTTEPVDRVLGGRLDEDDAAFVGAILEAQPDLSRSALVRLGVAALRDRVVRGGVPCPQCGMPLVGLDERCPACGG